MKGCCTYSACSRKTNQQLFSFPHVSPMNLEMPFQSGFEQLKKGGLGQKKLLFRREKALVLPLIPLFVCWWSFSPLLALPLRGRILA